MEQVHRPEVTTRSKRAGWFVLGGATIFAVLAASCCVLPIGFAIIGLGGSWLSLLAPLVAYREIILLIVGLVVAWSWRRLWRSRCNATRNRTGTAITVIATVAFVAALSAPLWENHAALSMWNYLIASR